MRCTCVVAVRAMELMCALVHVVEGADAPENMAVIPDGDYDHLLVDA
jgi:hypothetical protein